jgi:hypothetical protein
VGDQVMATMGRWDGPVRPFWGAHLALGTFVVLDAARKAGVRRLLCASSVNTFGTFYWRLSGRPVESERLLLDEEFPPMPEDPYSLGKLVNEETCAAVTRAYGIITAAFRFAGVWTEAMYDRTMSQGPRPTETWASDLYQWVHVRDIARGLRQALEHPDLPAHGVFVLGAPAHAAPSRPWSRWSVSARICSRRRRARSRDASRCCPSIARAAPSATTHATAWVHEQPHHRRRQLPDRRSRQGQGNGWPGGAVGWFVVTIMEGT